MDRVSPVLRTESPLYIQGIAINTIHEGSNQEQISIKIASGSDRVPSLETDLIILTQSVQRLWRSLRTSSASSGVLARETIGIAYLGSQGIAYVGSRRQSLGWFESPFIDGFEL
uniref:Uncharacterized protein n=1 Tax=Ananas comosus var. bracteatus TaxID=296719 RepID=A0A6V7P4Y2_ANACO|nr:unnamed protein product [Ananas comosus var. bracteatus]